MKNNHGFTLIETMVALLILGILGLMASQGLGGAFRVGSPRSREGVSAVASADASTTIVGGVGLEWPQLRRLYGKTVVTDEVLSFAAAALGAEEDNAARWQLAG